MDNSDAVPAAVDALADAMTQSYGQIALILDHMQRNDVQAPGSLPIPIVLGGLLRDVLEKLPEQHGVDDVATAAQMLAAATDLLAEEVLLVDMNRSERQAARRRGECG